VKNELVILVAPNVGEQMGGEAAKALQIFNEYKKIYPNVIQITHERNSYEIERLGLKDVYFVKDTIFSKAIYNSVIFKRFINPWFSKKAVHLAESVSKDKGYDLNTVIIHQTEPNSPVAPRSYSKKAFNVLGPINGNIYYPELYRSHETKSAKFRRILHFPLQSINRFCNIYKNADLIFCAGGERTKKSLLAAGCPEHKIFETIDCGVEDVLLDRNRVTHKERNPRFIHFGRLVFHKGTFLIIKSLVKTNPDIKLDIVGRGPELEGLKELTESLGLNDRVRFLDWYTKREDLFDSLSDYRGVILPSMEDANGLVVQESMAMGIIPICLDWGGPQLLVDHEKTGFLVYPETEEQITDEISKALDLLSEDYQMAEKMSLEAVSVAEGWRWSKVVEDWFKEYDKLIERTEK
jgi:glycosyltransferase involved in cell wall biosynthesis